MALRALDSLLIDDESDEDVSLAKVKEAVAHIATYTLDFLLKLKECMSFVALHYKVEEVVDYMLELI